MELPMLPTGKTRTDIRGKILRFLKYWGRMGILEVAKHLRISHEGARRQLTLMERYGWVNRKETAGSPGSLGRPRATYSITPTGDHLFPKAYDRLSSDIISVLGQVAGEGAVRKVLAALADKQVAAWEPMMRGKGPREKLEALRGLYAQDDPFMSVESRGEDLILVERNCPYLNVAKEHPALCSLSVTTLERLLGHPVIREERFQAGDGRCAFRVRLGRPLPREDFRFESEKPPADA